MKIEKKMLNNNQKLLHPIVKHIRFVAQQAIEGSHAAQLQKNTQHFFFLVALLPFRQQYVVSVCQKYSMFQWWDSTKLLDLGHAHNS